MKYLSALVIALIFTSSCCGTQRITKNQAESYSKTNILNATEETIKDASALEITSPNKKDNSTEISSDEKGTVNIDVSTKTSETIYSEAFDHTIFNQLLKKHVSKQGNVNYKGFKSESKVLQGYIDLLKTNQPNDSWTKADKLAYWINAYNALTIDLILKNHPIKSIKDIKNPWDQRLWKIGETWQNLNDIEHKILRKMNEPRIHFAIVCASVSCPKLQNKAFTASNIEAQLTNATKEFLADKSKNELSKNQIKLSKIFKWFKKDFEEEGSLLDFLNLYTDVSISSKAKKSFKDYDWNLND